MEGATYKITGLKVKEYNSKKSLSARSDSTFTQIDDISAVESKIRLVRIHWML